MNNIQELIELLEDRKSNAKKTKDDFYGESDYNRSFAAGSLWAFDLCVQKLKLLLNEESKQPQPPDFANTMLGEVPQVANDQQEEISKAVEGATPVVRQNEQTKEVCCVCKQELVEDYSRHGVCYDCLEYS